MPCVTPARARSSNVSKSLRRTPAFHADNPSSKYRPTVPPWRAIVASLSRCWVSIFSSSRVDGFHDNRAYESNTGRPAR